MSMPVWINHYTTNESPYATKVSMTGGIHIWFSYNEIIAIETPWDGLVASVNVWTRSTGKHLDAISHPSDRIKHSEFRKRVDELEKRLRLAHKHARSLTLMKRLEEADRNGQDE